MKNGRAKLRRGERFPKWTGKTWKSKLFNDDRLALKRYAQSKLVRTIKLCVEQKRKAQGPGQNGPPVLKRPYRSTFKLGLGRVALVAAMVFTAGTIYNYSYLHEGFGVLRNEGAKAALTFFQNKGESIDNLFGTAWAAYRSGDYERAEKLSKRVLKSPAMRDQARAYYLLGDLKTLNGEFDLAREHLLTALAMYETTGSQASHYRTRLALAKLYLAQKDVVNASYYTNLAETAKQARADQYFLYLKSQIAFLKSDFDGALALALQREKIFNGDRSRLASIFSDIGFYYGLTGNLEKCFKYTTKAQTITIEQEDVKSRMYNNINLCLYFKCTLQDYTKLREVILAYAEQNNDQKLIEQMYFVDKFSCEIELTDTGDLPPPD